MRGFGWSRLPATAGLGLALAVSSAAGSTLVPQTPLPGKQIPKFVTRLPTFGPEAPADLPRVSGGELVVRMLQTSQQVLPTQNAAGGPTGFGPTRVWAYQLESTGGAVLGPARWPAVSIEAVRGEPTTINYVNALPGLDPMAPQLDPSSEGFSLQALISVDQTTHWADPLNLMCKMGLSANCLKPYLGPVPAVAHLHGGEVPSVYDGGPDSWWTPGFAQTGPGFVTNRYVYLNDQEPGTLWLHDHALGATRTNVYSGLAAFYLLRDPENEPDDLPSGKYEVELAIQDRLFDTTGQLLFPDVGINPEHPFWLPEFFGDTIVVNGVTWPYLEVEARRYRLRVLNGSNARFYNLDFGQAPVWQIGGDANYLDDPVRLRTVLLAPGERADLIVDFAPVAGRSFVVTNDAKAPFPKGTPTNPQTSQVLQLRVGGASLAEVDESCNPGALPPQCVRPTPSARLAVGGVIPASVPVHRVRRMTLNEVMGAGGPLEVLVNNTPWTAPATELPRVGSTELWEIVNLTADAHPMHLHLVQFQILNRQRFQMNKYLKAYEASFPLGAFAPGAGPPLAYDSGEVMVLSNSQVPVVGGNPDLTRYLQSHPTLPGLEESGWKDTARAFPGEVTRLLVRWAPTDAPIIGSACSSPANPVPYGERPCRPVPGSNLFGFDPSLGITQPASTDFAGNPGGPGYVWHCHIIDHEDNEMMRPYQVAP